MNKQEFIKNGGMLNPNAPANKKTLEYVPSTQEAKIIESELAAHLAEVDAIHAILNERGKRYGEFTGHAQITQALKDCMTGCTNSKWRQLSDDKKEALEMIAHKIGRILNGDPNYKDHWVDIAGYATLVANTLKE